MKKINIGVIGVIGDIDPKKTTLPSLVLHVINKDLLTIQSLIDQIKLKKIKK